MLVAEKFCLSTNFLWPIGKGVGPRKPINQDFLATQYRSHLLLF